MYNITERINNIGSLLPDESSDESQPSRDECWLKYLVGSSYTRVPVTKTLRKIPLIRAKLHSITCVVIKLQPVDSLCGLFVILLIRQYQIFTLNIFVRLFKLYSDIYLWEKQNTMAFNNYRAGKIWNCGNIALKRAMIQTFSFVVLLFL